MSTRSHIIQVMPNNSVRFIYCHNNGYLERVGKTLFEHYQDPNKVNELINLGSISMLGEEIGKKHPFEEHYFHSGSNEYTKWCLAYGRDRGDADVSFEKAKNITAYNKETEDCFDIDFSYLYKNNEWYYRNNANQKRFVKITADMFK